MFVCLVLRQPILVRFGLWGSGTAFGPPKSSPEVTVIFMTFGTAKICPEPAVLLVAEGALAEGWG